MNTKKILLLLCGLAFMACPISAQDVDGTTGASSVQREYSKGETVVCRGEETHTQGRMVKVGKNAPKFTAVNTKLEDVSLADFKDRKVVLNIFPSLDTPTCAASVREFNARAASMEGVVVLCLSMDLPFAQARFCAAEGLENVVPLSLFRSPDFAKGYGLELVDGPMKGLTARAVIIVDGDGKVRYTQLVGDISKEPDYEAATAILGKLK